MGLIGACISLIAIGLLLACFAAWRLFAGVEPFTAYVYTGIYMLGALMALVGLFTLAGYGIWNLFG